MYKLIAITSHTEPNWADSLFPKFGCTLESVLKWRQVITFSNDKVVYYDVHIQPKINNVIGTEVWEFSSREDLIDFYSALNSADPVLNHNRPYDIEKFNEEFIKFGAERIDKIVDPNGVEEVLYSNKELL